MKKQCQGEKIKVLFFIPLLVGGGAERTFLNIINNLNRNEFEPMLILCRERGSFLDLLEKDVKTFCLNVPLRFAVISLALRIRKLKPDLVISTMRFPNLVTVLATKLSGLKPRLIVRESNNLTAAGINPHRFFERLVGWSYKRADKVVSLSNGVRVDMIKRYGLAPDSVITLFNPVDIDQIRSLARQRPEDNGYIGEKNRKHFHVIGVGKLDKQKGFDILIKAISRLKGTPIYLTILGDGPEKGHLSNLIRDLNLEDRVRIPGFKLNPYAFMARSDLFVLSSRWEGFGHVLAEAMACNVAVLSTRCPSGPDEIITDDVDGRLCKPDSVDDLAFNIEQLLKDDKTRKRYAEAGMNSVKRFEVKKIVREYEMLFNNFS